MRKEDELREKEREGAKKLISPLCAAPHDSARVFQVHRFASPGPPGVRVRARARAQACVTGQKHAGEGRRRKPSFLGDYLKCMGSAGNWVSLILNGATVAERSHPVNIPQHSHIPALVCQDPGPSHAASTPVERLYAGACETTPHSRTHYFFFFFYPSLQLVISC